MPDSPEHGKVGESGARGETWEEAVKYLSWEQDVLSSKCLCFMSCLKEKVVPALL